MEYIKVPWYYTYLKYFKVPWFNRIVVFVLFFFLQGKEIKRQFNYFELSTWTACI